MTLPFEREDVTHELARVADVTGNALLQAALLQITEDGKEIDRLRGALECEYRLSRAQTGIAAHSRTERISDALRMHTLERSDG